MPRQWGTKSFKNGIWITSINDTYYICIIFHETFKALQYCTVAIITRGLYFFNSLFEDPFFVFKDVFWEILSLCMVTFQDWSVCNQYRVVMAYTGLHLNSCYVKISLPNSNHKVFISKESNIETLVGVATLPLSFPPSGKLPF